MRRRRWLWPTLAALCIAAATLAAWPRGPDDLAAIRRFHPAEKWYPNVIGTHGEQTEDSPNHLLAFDVDPTEVGTALGLPQVRFRLPGVTRDYPLKLKSGRDALFDVESDAQGHTCFLNVYNDPPNWIQRTWTAICTRLHL
jgi:hypothetical protein